MIDVRKRKAWVGIAVAVALILVVSWSQKTDEFDFLRKFHPQERLYFSTRYKAHWCREFQFETLTPELYAALGIAPQGKQWKEGGYIAGLSDGNKSAWLIPRIKTLRIVNAEPPSWLALQWSALKQRTGLQKSDPFSQFER
jgi:hypothetical protein